MSVEIKKECLIMFVKYAIVAIISVIVDVILFELFLNILNIDIDTFLIVCSTVLARIVSSIVNFALNKKISFKSNEKVKDTVWKFTLLCVVQMFVSGFSVAGIYNLTKAPEVIIKLCVDTLLFFVNFIVQKLFIFKV